MLKFRFAHRVAVHHGHAVYYKAAGAAAHLVDSGQATVRSKVSMTVTAIEMTAVAIGYTQGQMRVDRLGLRPGSYGIRTETFPSGFHCFDHRNPWHQVRAHPGRGG
jgi:hypothetical protein